MRHTVCLSSLLIALLPALASAQPARLELTLSDAIARATNASQRLAETRAREQGAQATVRVRRAADQPTVSVSGGYSRTNHVDEFGVPLATGGLRVIYPDIPDNYFTRASLQWPIYSGGRADALEEAAQAEARAAGHDVTVARADLRLEVVRAYWALATASQSVRVLQEGLDRANAHLADVRSRFDAGLVPPNDVASVEAQRSRQQMLLIEAQNLRASIAEDLRRLTGTAAGTEMIPTDALDPLPSSAGSPDDQIATALKSRAERSALLERIRAAEERREAATSGKLPSLVMTANVDYANPNPRIFPRDEKWRHSWDVSVLVSWPIWDAGRVDAETAEAVAAVAAARARAADLDTLITTDVRQRILDLDSAHAVLSAAADAVRSAAEARRVVAERFNVGVATSTEVLDAQVALLQAELDRTRALANLRLAEARLDRAVGR